MTPEELGGAPSEERASKGVHSPETSYPDRRDDRQDTGETGLVEQQRLFQKFRPGAGKFEQILGVRFFNGTAEEAVDYITRVRGYTVVPAAPALVNIERDAEYRRALLESDLAIADSGFMVLLWRILRARKITRTSGLKYLKLLLARADLRHRGRTFFVLPSDQSRRKALSWLRTQQVEVSETETYVAPRYGYQIEDESLVEVLNERKPDHVIIGIGGGTQEKLGYYLREHLSYRPAIHCIGAALGFLTGDQAPIPMWADRLYLGWLLRLIRQPRLYGPRYVSAFRLPGLILRCGARSPSAGNAERELRSAE